MEIKADPILRRRPQPKGRPSLSQVSAASRLFAAMGFSKRLLILLHLMDGERSVSEMVSLIGASRTALSQHLSGMAKLSIVKSRTQGKRRFYSCTSEQAKMVVSFLSDLADRDILPVGNARIATSFAKRLNSNDGGPNRPWVKSRRKKDSAASVLFDFRRYPISRASLINTVQTPDRGWRRRTARPPIA
ncbi:ArsR/SmtB family transcription factor [Mesorhizobium australicum]|uniref:ArsR/SmtB family transcription factor n=1 Tax=Mesorhizobium australicum TaxID=536018 RepID=UPI00333AA52A